MEIVINASLGHSPIKKKIVLYTQWFAAYNLGELEKTFDEDITWSLVGDHPVSGKTEFVKALNKMKENRAVQLTINHIVNHGKEAAIDGVMKMSDGKIYGFADFYNFSDVKGNRIKAITSYVAQLEN